MAAKILAISGSTRKNSTNESILRTIAELYRDRLEVRVFAQLDTLPHFNPDKDGDRPQGAVKEFRDLIAQADGVIICTPEYVFSLPGVLKNALEWTVSTTVFSGKPAAFIVASSSGEKAFESLELILTTIQAVIGDRSKLLIRGPKAKMNDAGALSDRGVLKDIDTLVQSLVRTIEQKRSAAGS